MPQPHDKTYFRETVREQVQAMDAQDRIDKDRQILARLRDFPVYRELRTVLLYHPMADEIDLMPLIKEHLASGRSVCLPLCQPGTHTITIKCIQGLDDLIAGTYGIMEPGKDCEELLPQELEGIMVPGRAFDKAGQRVGRGAGYYDRLFSQTQAVTIAAAYSLQLFPRVPVEAHDRPVDYIITEQEIISCIKA